VAQQILPVFKTDSSGTKAMAERVSQIMHPYHRQSGSVSRSFPSVIPDAGDSLPTVCEYDTRMLAPLSFNDASGNPIENHNSLLFILCD
jgi:hypothetical protein